MEVKEGERKKEMEKKMRQTDEEKIKIGSRSFRRSHPLHKY